MPDLDVVILPGFPLGTQVYKYPGSVWVSTDVFYKIVRGIGESLAKFGYQHIYILSGHGAPKDIAAIDSACVKVSKRYKIKMNNLSGELAVSFLKGDFADRISEKLEKPLTPEELSILKKDFHGGWWETSMMLLLYPELVSEEYKNLPDKEKNAETLRERNGYFGSPSRASAEFARVSLEVITEEALRLINISQMENERGQALVSPLHKYLTLRPYFLRRIISISLIIIKTAVIIYIIYKILR